MTTRLTVEPSADPFRVSERYPISARSLPAARSGRSSPIRSIRDDLGTTIVFVEQNLETILTLADRCYVMEKGRIVAAIPPGAVTSETVRRHLLL